MSSPIRRLNEHVLFHVAQELSTGSDIFALTCGLNLSLPMIQKDYFAYVAVPLGWELMSGRSHKAVNRIIRVEV